MKTKVLINYCILCFIWGTTWFVLKKSLTEGTPPFFGSGLRFFIAGLILWSILLFKKERPPFNKISKQIYFQFGIMNLTISYGLTYWATQFIYSSLSSIIWSGFPLCVAIFSFFMLPDEIITKKKIISLILGTFGAILILMEGLSFSGNSVAMGIVLVMIAVIIASYPSVYLKRYSNVVSSLHLNAVSQLMAGSILLIISSIFETNEVMNWSSFNIFALFYLTIPGSLIAWYIYIWLYSHISMAQISYIAFFPPLLASIIGWFILDERLSMLSLFGGSMVILGAVLINLNE
jgi:drug/metabolite transporter (DMT)-like permease|tara:strand:- start:16222 stop:17094 length:873 start_codon:yes stop_codon:yes gene_type:complete